MTKRKYLIPILALSIAEIAWGINTVFIKMGLQSIPPSIFITIRFLLASLIIIPFAFTHWKPLKKKEWFLLLLASIFNITLNALAMNIGLTKTSAINAAVILMLEPIVLFMLSAAYLKEGLNLKTFIGIIVALIGSLIIIGKPGQAGTDHMAAMSGNLLIVIAVFCSVIGILICKPIAKKVGSYQMTFMLTFPGIIPVALYSITQIHTWNVKETSKQSVYGLFGSVVTIIIANFLFYYALRYKKAESIGVYQYLSPIATFVAAWFLLGEYPNGKFIFGTALVFLGVYVGGYMGQNGRLNSLAKNVKSKFN